MLIIFQDFIRNQEYRGLTRQRIYLSDHNCLVDFLNSVVFQDFFRASNVGGTQGSGLGLSIAKKIIDAHYGKITVENIAQNDEISGTRFTVCIPRDLKTPEMQRREWQAMEESSRIEVEG